MLNTFLLAGAMAAGLTTATLAGDLGATDAYARVSGASAKSGAVFLVLTNAGGTDDTLIAATTPVAERTELHTHLQDANGVMRMVEVEDGFPVPAGGSHPLARGGDHVMLMGLKAPLENGQDVALSLDFGPCGTVAAVLSVDNDRKPEEAAPMHHGAHAMPAPATN